MDRRLYGSRTASRTPLLRTYGLSSWRRCGRMKFAFHDESNSSLSYYSVFLLFAGKTRTVLARAQPAGREKSLKKYIAFFLSVEFRVQTVQTILHILLLLLIIITSFFLLHRTTLTAITKVSSSSNVHHNGMKKAQGKPTNGEKKMRKNFV